MLEILIAIVVAFAAGWYISGVFNRWIFSLILDKLGVDHKKLRELNQDLERELGDEPKSKPQPDVQVKLEQHLGTIYAYRKDNNEFIAQGRDRQELLAAMLARFPTEDKFRLSIVEGTELLEPVAKTQQ